MSRFDNPLMQQLRTDEFAVTMQTLSGQRARAYAYSLDSTTAFGFTAMIYSSPLYKQDEGYTQWADNLCGVIATAKMLGAKFSLLIPDTEEVSCSLWAKVRGALNEVTDLPDHMAETLVEFDNVISKIGATGGGEIFIELLRQQFNLSHSVKQSSNIVDLGNGTFMDLSTIEVKGNG